MTLASVEKKSSSHTAQNLLVVMVTLYFTSQTLVNISSAPGAGASARGLFGTCRDQLESEKPNCESQTFHNSRQSALILDCLVSCKFLHEYSIKNKHCISTYLRIFHIVA